MRCEYAVEERITILNAGPGRPGQRFDEYAPRRGQWVMPGIEEQRLPSGPPPPAPSPGGERGG